MSQAHYHTESQLAKSLWLLDKGDLSGEPRNTTEADPKWQLVPLLFEQCCEWAHIYKIQHPPDRSRPYYFLYKIPDPANGVYSVLLRLQGFVKNCSLGPLGTWNGYKHSH